MKSPNPLLLLPTAAALAILVSVSACAGSLVHKKPESSELNQATTDLWARDIRRVAKSGDWILTRSYSKTGDAIVGVTKGESFSHAVVYDAERGTVIEAITPKVREVPLEQLLKRNRYAVVVRPIDISDEQRQATVARARSAIGASFDYRGMLGIDDKDRFYCSELAAWASQIPDQPTIVTPADLYDRAELVYISGARDDAELQSLALSSKKQSGARVAYQGQ
jgi:uncharacterized protein YycO